MINGDTAVMSPEACGYTTQLSLAELEFTRCTLIGSEQRPLWYFGQSGKTSLSIHKTLHHKMKGMIKELWSILSEPRDWKQEEKDK